jgi:hypothetical protein
MATGKNVYLEDYAALSDLQKLTSKYNVTIIVVHHDRKSGADDVFDTVSGSLGLPAAADTIAILKREASAVTLHVRGGMSRRPRRHCNSTRQPAVGRSWARPRRCAVRMNVVAF